jgi:hypothetical protein
MMNRLHVVLAVCFAAVVLAFSAEGRVISYAPYTDHTAFPALQSRANRFFVLVEGTLPPLGTAPGASYGQLVVYDSTDRVAPRVVFPQDGSSTVFTVAAAREGADGNLTLLVQNGQQIPGSYLYDLWFSMSTDGGKTWKERLDLPRTQIAQIGFNGSDIGGPFTVSHYSPVRIGTAEVPFVVASTGKVYAVLRDGSTKVLYTDSNPNPPLTLAGSDVSGSRFLVRTSTSVIVLGLDGSVQTLTNSFLDFSPRMEGWITPAGDAYLEERAVSTLQGKIWFFNGGQKKELVDARWTDSNTPTAFAVPTWDYSGAWIIQRGGGKPTTLSTHTAARGLVEQWSDITAPEVEALHAGSSGQKLLIQVHRPRPADVRIFKDPALAVWKIGNPAPLHYDELFMNEQLNKGFVHLNVETIDSGESFVFDSGSVFYISGGSGPGGGGGNGGGGSGPPTSGGSDVSQEWGVVRASLRQRLVLPSVGRTRGAFGSDWVTDVIIHNPTDAAQHVALTLVTAPDGTASDSLPRHADVVIGAHEVRLIGDVVSTLFQLDSGTGALFLDPESGVNVTSRTYTRTGNGTYGFGMNAVDAFAAAGSPRFPVTFSGALPGANFRTNVVVTDMSGQGTETVVAASGADGAMGVGEFSFASAPNSYQQVNGVGNLLGVLPSASGALSVRPLRGIALAAAFAVDNRTNDSTYFPPDLPATSATRTIPAIGHVDGANGSRFRSDLYLFNPSPQPRAIALQVKSWDKQEAGVGLTLTLLANEARVIRDILFTVFGRTGIARLQYQALTAGPGVRVTSRTYTVDENGGTYGFLMPPLNAFQSGAAGDILEILGAVADPKFRTNIGLVETSANAFSAQQAAANIEIFDSAGKRLDSFVANVPAAGGIQLNDIFAARQITASGPVLIRIAPQRGTIGAYATSTDNVTNDSVYLAANLAPKG